LITLHYIIDVFVPNLPGGGIISLHVHGKNVEFV